MAFSDTVYSGPMLEGLNRAKLGYMDQDTQRLRDVQTLQAAMARVQAMNRQTDAGERSSTREWDTRGRLGEAQNMTNAAEVANRRELGLLNDGTTRFGMTEATARALAEREARENIVRNQLEAQAESDRVANLNRLAVQGLANEGGLANINAQGRNFIAQSLYGMPSGNQRGMADMASLGLEVSKTNGEREAIAGMVDRALTPEAYEASKSWYKWDDDQPEYQRKQLEQFSTKYPGAFTWDGKAGKAFPVLQQNPMGALQNNMQANPMERQRTVYTIQYGPMPTTRVPGTMWGPDYVVGEDGKWRNAK